MHVSRVVSQAGVRWPGYLSVAEDIKFTDMPGGTIASWAALPGLAWVQIVLVVALLDNSVLAQDPAKVRRATSSPAPGRPPRGGRHGLDATHGGRPLPIDPARR